MRCCNIKLKENKTTRSCINFSSYNFISSNIIPCGKNKQTRQKKNFNNEKVLNGREEKREIKNK
jgi:hypothetical protein